MQEEREQGGQKSKIRMSAVFEAESIALQFTWILEKYQKNPRVWKGQHTNVCGHAVHLCRILAWQERVFGLLDYHEHGEI